MGDSPIFGDAYVAHAQRGTDGTDLSDYDLIGSTNDSTGIFALNHIEHFDLLYLPPPSQDRDPGPAAMLVAEQFSAHREGVLVQLARLLEAVGFAIQTAENVERPGPFLATVRLQPFPESKRFQVQRTLAGPP